MSSAGASLQYNLMMLRRRRKNDIKPEVAAYIAEEFIEKNFQSTLLRRSVRSSFRDYFRFVIYCTLLAVPLYAITKSILRHDWLMVMVDALIVPVGFVHGLLLLFGYVT
jgi:hypothetical protein